MIKGSNRDDSVFHNKSGTSISPSPLQSEEEHFSSIAYTNNRQMNKTRKNKCTHVLLHCVMNLMSHYVSHVYLEQSKGYTVDSPSYILALTSFIGTKISSNTNWGTVNFAQQILVHYFASPKLWWKQPGAHSHNQMPFRQKSGHLQTLN